MSAAGSRRSALGDAGPAAAGSAATGSAATGSRGGGSGGGGSGGPARAFVGVVLAGGLGLRMGAGKPAALLGGRPLAAYPLDALRAACDRVVVVAKADTELPALDAERWDEPALPRHPAVGIRHALERAGGPILVCAADMPFVTPDVLELLAAELQPGLTAVVAFAEGRLEPLLAAYAPEALELLAAAPEDEPLRRTVESLMPVPLDVDPALVFNVNTPDDLADAERRLSS